MQDNSLHRKHFYTQTLLHTDAFTHKSFYTQKLLHTEAFTQKSFHTQKLLQTDTFTHRHFYTQKLLHTNPFTPMHFYTQTLVHTNTCTHKHLYTETLLHTNPFTHKHFYTQKLLHTDTFTHWRVRIEIVKPYPEMIKSRLDDVGHSHEDEVEEIDMRSVKHQTIQQDAKVKHQTGQQDAKKRQTSNKWAITKLELYHVDIYKFKNRRSWSTTVRQKQHMRQVPSKVESKNRTTRVPRQRFTSVPDHDSCHTWPHL